MPQSCASIADIRHELLDLCGTVRPPASNQSLDSFCARFAVQLPEDLKAAYLLMDGADHSTNPEKSWIRFWPIEEFISAKGSLPVGSSETDKGRLFVFADYAIECVYYVIDLQPKSDAFGRVYALGATRIADAAHSFSEFVSLVLANSDELHTYS